MCLESSEQQADGRLTFTETGRVNKVPAGSKIALAHSGFQGLKAAREASEHAAEQGIWHSDAEEEEAFLEAVNRQQGAYAPQQSDELLLQCRWAGAVQWVCHQVLREGTSCSTGVCAYHLHYQQSTVWQQPLSQKLPAYWYNIGSQFGRSNIYRSFKQYTGFCL